MTLPTVDGAHAQVVATAASFVVIDKTGAIHFGPIRPGSASYAGFEARDNLDSSLDAIAPPNGVVDETNTDRDPGRGSAANGSAANGSGSAANGAANGSAANGAANGSAANGAANGSAANGAANGSAVVPGSSLGIGGGTGAGFAPPRPTIGLLIRGVVSPSIDTIVLADRDVDAGIVTDTIAGLSTARIVGLGVASSGDVMRYELAFHAKAPRKRGEVGAGVAFVVSARGVTWWIEKPGGASEVVETAWSDGAREKLVAWVKQQRSLAHAYVAIEGGTRLSHVMTALSALGDAGATDIELGRRYLVDKDGNVANYTRRPPRTDANVSTDNDADQKSVLRTFRQRTPQLWACIDKGRTAKPSLAGTLAASFVVHEGAPQNLITNGIEPSVDACLGDVIREMRFTLSAAEVTVDAKLVFPKG